MPLGPEEIIRIPLGLKIVLWAELIIFTPFTIKHYFGTFDPVWKRMSQTKLGQMSLWSGEMLNGVGAITLMYMIFDTLCTNKISLIEVEILFISHALWMGCFVAFCPPPPAFIAVFGMNPHFYLTVGVWATASWLVRGQCLIVSGAIMAFGLYRQYFQFRGTIFPGEPFTMDAFERAYAALKTQEEIDAKLQKNPSAVKSGAAACVETTPLLSSSA
mmetsp:Transcript_120597/g.336504  ORF Transcript_120597/g.336504 Transcript_120597/m.336504 type:complete len:216 (+) Transcript_120597:52-699(+)